MSTKINATGPVARGDVYRLNPEDITLCHNSRIIPAKDYPEKVKNRALSIIKHGQLQPARGHKDANDRVVLDVGHTRYDAVKLIRDGFKAVDPDDGEERFFQDRDLQLDLVVDREIKSDEDSFIASLIENSQRDDTTDVQEALAQQKLREDFKWSDSKIARTYGYSNSNRVGYLKQLLTLPQDVVDRVHEGTLALHTALEVKKVPEGEKRDTVIQQIANGEPLVAADVRDVAREALEAEGSTEQPDEKPAKKKNTKKPADSSPGLSRSVRDFRNFNKELQDPNTVAADSVKVLFQHLEEWFAGGRQDRSLWKAIEEIKGPRTTK